MTPPTPPQPPQQSPEGPQSYRHGGKVLAVLAIAYFLTLWFAVLGEMGNAAIFGTFIFALTVLCYGLFAVDWRGYTSLNGLIKWNQMQTGQKAGMGCLFFILLPFMPFVYFVRAIKQHNAATQQTMNTRMQSAWQGFKTTSRKNQAVISAVLAVAVLAFCSLSSVAARGGNGLGSSTPPVNQVADTGGAPTSTPSTPHNTGPTATPKPTATPAPPTPTPVPPTPTPAPTWQTVQTFSGNGISKTGTFTENADQWKIVWSCNPQAYGSEYNLMADLTPPGQDFGDSVVNVICKADDPSTTHGETMEYSQGTYYLDVNSEASWTFQIQELK